MSYDPKSKTFNALTVAGLDLNDDPKKKPKPLKNKAKKAPAKSSP
jgi:hypothetical protein